MDMKTSTVLRMVAERVRQARTIVECHFVGLLSTRIDTADNSLGSADLAGDASAVSVDLPTAALLQQPIPCRS